MTWFQVNQPHGRDDGANNAISHATKDSLILFDELGTGELQLMTGMALAQSIIEYIMNISEPRPSLRPTTMS